MVTLPFYANKSSTTQQHLAAQQALPMPLLISLVIPSLIALFTLDWNSSGAENASYFINSQYNV